MRIFAVHGQISTIQTKLSVASILQSPVGIRKVLRAWLGGISFNDWLSDKIEQ